MDRTSTTQITEPLKISVNEVNDGDQECSFDPGDNIINNILNYSKALSIRKSQTLEHFEMVLN